MNAPTLIAQLGAARERIKAQGIENANLRRLLAESNAEVKRLEASLREHTRVGA
jgi:hypothetical protein